MAYGEQVTVLDVNMHNEPSQQPAMQQEFLFSEKTIRRAFVKKVFGILAIQLVITFGIVAIFVFVEEVKTYAYYHWELAVGSSIATIVIVIALACCENVRRRAPFNVIILFIFTVLEGFMLGSFAGLFEAKEVMIAVGVCIVVCVGLSVFAFQTKVDFTMWTGLGYVLLLNLVMFGIFAGIFNSNILNIAYSVLGSLIFSLYLVIDIQLVMGGSHKYAISPEEYIFAALNLYLDIINIFIYILACFGGSD